MNNGFIQWWCGNESVTPACHSGDQAHLVDYSSGSILGVGPVTPTPCSTIGTQIYSTSFHASNTPTTLTTTQNAASVPPTATPPPQSQPSQSATAIGAGIGVPLGIAATGFLGLIFWRERRRRKPHNNPETMRPKHDTTQAHNGWGAELWDTPLRRELHGSGGTIELQGTGSRPELSGGEVPPRLPHAQSILRS